jgi:RimJ/RimL family protein N-acetyltransferase
MIPTEGVLCQGQQVLLSWPDEGEYGAITELRNRPLVRKWFLDSRPIDPESSRNYLIFLKRPQDAVLSIRWKRDSSFLGTVGWSCWDQSLGTACFGRLMVDRSALKRFRAAPLHSYPGVAIDAAIALRDYAFDHMELREMTTWYLAGNRLAARVNRAVGMVERGRDTRVRPDGSPFDSVELSMSRDQWKRIRAGR